MLKPIPKRILTHNAVLKVPSAVDAYGGVSYKTYNLSHVHIQPTHSVRKSTQDKEVMLNAMLFYDCRLSLPSLDWSSLQSASDTLNAQMKVSFKSLEYTVFSIDLVPDDEGNLHHVEVAMI